VRSPTSTDAAHEILFDKNPSPMWFYDADTLRFVAVNDAAVQKYGYSRDELLAMTIKDIRPPDDLERLLGSTSRRREGLERSVGWRHRAKDGRIFHVEIIRYPVVYAGRACVLVLAHDVSARVEAERELEEMRAKLALSERMASIGTLATGVGHEINNPLTFVLANLTFVQGRLDAPGEAIADAPALRDALAEAVDGARRVQAIARDLTTFSRANDTSLVPVDLGRVTSSALALASNQIGGRARTVVDVAGAPPVLANEAQLGQVLLNLVVNAAQAIPEGDVARNEIRVAARREGARVVVEVSDTGGGVPREIRDRIFDPFFTTKPVGHGTGLGLWICQRIATAFGGSLELVDGGARGATFQLALPAAEMAGTHRPPAAARPNPPASRRPRLLVVDDEPLVGRSLQRSLRDDADITFEESARAAVARLSRGERFDLVLADVMMPQCPGSDLHAELERLDPALARGIVFMTGGAFSARQQEFLARIANVCLEKPLDLARLRSLLHAAAAEPPRRD